MGHRRSCVVAASLLAALAAGCIVGSAPDDGDERADPMADLVPVEIPLDVDGTADLTRNFYFILDGSASMGDRPDGRCLGDQSFPTKLSGAKWAVETFMTQVPADVNLGLYVFDAHDPGERVPLGPDNQQAFLRAVDDVRASGGTPLAESIRFGADRLVARYQRQLGYGEYRLVVVTDGQAEEIPEAVAYSARHRIPIHAIGLCIGENHPLRQYAWRYRAADNFADLARGLEETLAETTYFAPTEFEAVDDR